MCLVCKDWERGKLTPAEAKRNLFELVQTADPESRDHIQDVWAQIVKKEREDAQKEGAD